MKKDSSGFTLVEVAIAVAILGLAFSTLVGLHTTMINTYSLERNRNISALVGQYMLAFTEIAPEPPEVGNDSGDLIERLADFGYLDEDKNYFKDDLEGWTYETSVESFDLLEIEDVYRRIELRIKWGEQVDQTYQLVYFIFTSNYL